MINSGVTTLAKQITGPNSLDRIDEIQQGSEVPNQTSEKATDRICQNGKLLTLMKVMNF